MTKESDAEKVEEHKLLLTNLLVIACVIMTPFQNAQIYFSLCNCATYYI